jgi:hypothetical protein
MVSVIAARQVVEVRVPFSLGLPLGFASNAWRLKGTSATEEPHDRATAGRRAERELVR